MNDEFKEKIVQTVDTVSSLRGFVITKAIDIESLIGAIIVNYYVSSKKHSSFDTLVISDPYFSFGLKINILKKIINEIKFVTYDKFKDDLHRAEKLRNRLAHSVMFGFDGHLAYSKGEKPMGIKKAKEMHDEFIILYPKIFDELLKILNHIIESEKQEKNK